ncbi:hypothetical protein [Candidatus Leptofilum sp.]|uniref:hypothetical protein n=1 Tax=Candidatus Leptofilum sp. TaxID=3241576 RepID=UPI003B5A28B9
MHSQQNRRLRHLFFCGLATAVFISSLFIFLTDATGKVAQPTHALDQPALPGSNPSSTDLATYLPLVMVPEAPCVYVETSDAVVIEIESIPAVDDWQLETSFPGYIGNGYYVWRGPEYYGSPGNGILTYPISVTKSSDYQLNIRNSHPTNPSLYNDVWVRLDNGPWIKSFSNVLNAWTYDFNFDRGGGNLGAAIFEDVTAGLHTLELSARSAGFRLDRLVFSANGSGQLVTEPESPCVVP